MSSRKLALATVAAAVVALGGVLAAGIVLAGGDGGPAGAGTSAAPPRKISDVRQAPDLRGVDPVTGKNVTLSDFRGKPVVLNVWASWCPGCIDEAADLRRFASAHPEAAVLGIDFQDPKAAARDFYRRWQWTHPSIWDVSGSMTAALGLQGMPTTYFLSADHRIVAQVVGATDLAGFEQGLEAAKQAS